VQFPPISEAIIDAHRIEWRAEQRRKRLEKKIRYLERREQRGTILPEQTEILRRHREQE